MIYVIAAVTTKEGKLQDWLKIFKKVQPLVHKEDGCYSYTVHTPASCFGEPADPNRAVILEKWESLEHLAAHIKTDHMVAFFAEVKDLLNGTTDVQILDEDI